MHNINRPLKIFIFTFVGKKVTKTITKTFERKIIFDFHSRFSHRTNKLLKIYYE